MRQLHPSSAGADAPVEQIYGAIAGRAAAPRGAYVLLNMVSSADGAISLDGLSGGLSGSADKEVFFYLRSLADVVLVGASTARAENYGPVRLSDERVRERAARGQQPTPRIAVVTRSLKIDWASRLFTSGGPRPYVICPATASPDLVAAAAEVADVITAGNGDVDLTSALAELVGAVVLCEGGPTVNGQLLSAGLVDELCLTISPALVGGSGPRISGWADAHKAQSLQLLSVAEAGGVLMLRYAVGPPGKLADHE